MIPNSVIYLASILNIFSLNNENKYTLLLQP